MKKINEFITIIDENNTVDIGKYSVGKNLIPGEYYLWGKDVRYKYKRGGYDYSNYDICESYAVLEGGDVFELEKGNMTLVSNICYINNNIHRLVPGHVYRVKKEIPIGYYLYKYAEEYFVEEEVFLERDECAVDMYKAHSDSRFYRENGKYGCALVDESKKHVEIKNGIACYYGNKKFDVVDFLEETVREDVKHNSNGITLLKNDIIEIQLFQSNVKKCYFMGKAVVCVYKYYWYSVDGATKWTGRIRPLSFRTLNSLTIEFRTLDGMSVNRKLASFEYRRIFNDAVYGEHYLISTELPPDYLGKKIQIVLKELNGVLVDEHIIYYEGLDHETDKYAIREIYRQEFDEVANVMQKYEDLNIPMELAYFEECPDLIEHILPTLKDIVENREKILNKVQHGKTVFRVRATYDKKFYCAAKISDMAESVQPVLELDVFDVIFRNTQIAEIELMSYLLYDISRDEDQKIKEFLNENSVRYYTMNQAQMCITELNDMYGYSSSVTNSVLVRIIKNEKKALQRMIERIYSDIVKENRVPTRWGNEYRLFSLMSNYNSNAVYQYRCDWLGQQSLDIFLEKEKIAIEYQGKQHYESIEYFGGEKSLKSNQERDARKKKLCMENGVQLFEWSYLTEVNPENVRNFLEENGIPINNDGNAKAVNDSIMAPVVQPKERKKPKKARKVTRPKYYIVQYDMQGNYVESFKDVGNAALKVGVSNTSISKVLRGERNSAANFIWRRYDVDKEIPQRIDVTFDTTKTNSGKAKRIGRIGNGGIVEKEFNSISDATRVTGISSNHIKSELTKINSTEWKYL